MSDRYQELKDLAVHKSVLIVDDDNIMRTVLTKNLSEYFGNVKSVTNGKMALEYYSQHNNFDIIITDIKMEYLNGLELIKEIKKINPKQKIIVMSMTKDEDILIDLINLKIDGFILKPFARKIFFDKIVEIIKDD